MTARTPDVMRAPLEYRPTKIPRNSERNPRSERKKNTAAIWGPSFWPKARTITRRHPPATSAPPILYQKAIAVRCASMSKSRWTPGSDDSSFQSTDFAPSLWRQNPQKIALSRISSPQYGHGIFFGSSRIRKPSSAGGGSSRILNPSSEAGTGTAC